MKITRHFLESADRYNFDFKACTYALGWAQVDTKQDASYFGTWANPRSRTILNYAEGDVTISVAATDAEFAEGLREIDRWNIAHGYGPARIDPGYDPAMKADFEAIGLADLLH